MPAPDLRAKISVLESVEFTELLVVYLYPKTNLDAATYYVPGLSGQNRRGFCFTECAKLLLC